MNDPYAGPTSPRLPGHRPRFGGGPLGWLGKLLSVALGLVLIALVFAFSLVLLGVAFFGGIALWAYFRYRLAKLAPRRQAGVPPPTAATADAAPGGRIIEGEARREDTSANPRA